MSKEIDELISCDLWILWRAREAISDLHATQAVLPVDNIAVMEVLNRMENQIQDCKETILRQEHQRAYITRRHRKE